MHLRKYPKFFHRREFLRRTTAGMVGAGLLAPLWETIASTGDAAGAYPDELLSIDEYTGGKISDGDTIDSSNVEYVKDLLEPIRYQQILRQGRTLTMRPTTTDIMRLSPWEYIEATLRNAGQGRFDARGNVVTADGQPWIGGNPFPNPTSAEELYAAQVLSWGRHDASLYAMKMQTVDKNGRDKFSYSGLWAELNSVCRVAMGPKPYWEKFRDKLRFQSFIALSPNQSRDTSFLNIWDYDQNKFPLLYGYIPEFRRIRQFPTDQRFEPLLPGTTLYLSDAWGAGDPMRTWGDFKIVGRGPFLAGISDNWNDDHNNWEQHRHGGPEGKSFFNTKVELVPEAIIVEARPTAFARAPVSKKHLWFDARNQVLIGMVTYDRNGKPFRSFDGSYSLYQSDKLAVMDGQHPYWSWTQLTASDIQTNEVTLIQQVRELDGIYQSKVNDPTIYEDFLTRVSMIRMGKN